MKAVIMAGGEGTRLRPLSLGRPKPMTPLFDKPVMEHIITLLRHSGITDIAVTLQYMPRVVTDYFGDGSSLGVHLHYFVEREPLGTAGSVKNCMEFLGEEDFLVISGDSVCDLDLCAAIAYHNTRRSAATLVLYRHPTPLEYGLVLTDDEGKITRFVEKPSWGQVLTNMVNTGIYILTHRAMAQVPAGQAFDFGRELFPLLLSQGESLYGHGAEGYWCDMGDCAAYLDCMADALAGKVHLDIPAPRVAPGVWATSPIPDGVQVVPPVYIGPNVVIEPGCLIGPHTALGAGSTVGRQSLVQRAALHGAHVGKKATLYGTILCRGATVRGGGVLNEGTVLGEEASAGEDAILLEGVKVWPGRVVPDGGRLTASLTAGGMRDTLKFADGGVLRGILGEDITPELLLLLGNILGADGALGLGACGGDGAQMLARAAGSGSAAAGGRVLGHDAPCAAAAAWMGGYYGLPATLFVEQAGEQIYLHLFDSQGMPLGRARERKVESALLRAEQTRMPAPRVGKWEHISGVGLAYGADGARRGRLSHAPLRRTEVAVIGSNPADLVMVQALEQLGCTVYRVRQEGIPAFQTGHGGFRLTAWDEEGEVVGSATLLTVVAMIEYEDGGGRVAVPHWAPAAIDTLAAGYGSGALRLGRDGRAAEDCYVALPWLRDAVFAACRICSRMGITGQRLRALTGKVPRFALSHREVPLRRDRGTVMQALVESLPGAELTGEGLRVSRQGGWAYLAPLTRRAALRVVAEGANAELAEEICGTLAEAARRLDQSAQG